MMLIPLMFLSTFNCNASVRGADLSAKILSILFCKTAPSGTYARKFTIKIEY